MINFKKFLNEQFNPLKHNDLTRRPFRMEIFFDKLKNKEPFGTKYGEIILNPNMIIDNKTQDVYTADNLKQIFSQKGIQLTFVTSNGKKIEYPKDFLKTSEFGGKGKGTSVSAENFALKKLNNTIEILKEETRSTYLTIKHKGKVYKITHAESTPGTPKSDFHLVGLDGKPVFWISHKASKKGNALDFQQYGGLQELDKATKSKDIESFVDAVKIFIKVNHPNAKVYPDKTSLFRKVKDKNVILKSMYGIDYGKKYGKQNVQVLIQGDIILENKGKYFEIYGSTHTMNNGELPKGGYEAVYFSRKSADRTNFGIKGARFFVVPIAYAKARKSQEI